MKKEEKDCLFLKDITNQTATYLKNNEGNITLENRTESQVLTITIPKKDKAIIHDEDIPRCKHIL